MRWGELDRADVFTHRVEYRSTLGGLLNERSRATLFSIRPLCVAAHQDHWEVRVSAPALDWLVETRVGGLSHYRRTARPGQSAAVRERTDGVDG